MDIRSRHDRIIILTTILMGLGLLGCIFWILWGVSTRTTVVESENRTYRTEYLAAHDKTHRSIGVLSDKLGRIGTKQEEIKKIVEPGGE